MATYALSVFVLRGRLSFRNTGSAVVYSALYKWSFKRYPFAGEVSYLVCVEHRVGSEACRASSDYSLYRLDAFNWPIFLANGV